jgi:hypothetical protein
MTKTRDCSQDAKNINKRKQVFEVFTSRVSSQFERVEMKTAIFNNEKISMKVERVIQQTNSISRRERERERQQERDQESDRTRKTRDRKRDRDRDQEKNQELNRTRESRDRERDQTMKSENENDLMKDVLVAK